MRVANNPLLARRHWGTIVEAGLALAAASAATRLLPFRRYIGLGARPLDRAKPIGGMRPRKLWTRSGGARLSGLSVCNAESRSN